MIKTIELSDRAALVIILNHEAGGYMNADHTNKNLIITCKNNCGYTGKMDMEKSVSEKNGQPIIKAFCPKCAQITTIKKSGEGHNFSFR